MQYFEIITERTSIDVRFDPHLPGLGVHATGLSGYLKGTSDREGVLDVSRPVSGEFAVSVGDFDLGNRLITYAAKKWLGQASELAVTGAVEGVRAVAERAFEMTVVSDLRGRNYSISGQGTITAHCSETLLMKGFTRLHPRDVGVPVPRFGIPWVHCQFLIALTRPG